MNYERPILMMSAPDSGGGTNPSSASPEQTPEENPLQVLIQETVAFYVDNHAKANLFEEGQKTILIEGETQLINAVGEKNGGNFSTVNPLQERDRHFRHEGDKATAASENVRKIREALLDSGIPANQLGRIMSSVFTNTLDFLKDEKVSGNSKQVIRKTSLNTTGTQKYTSTSARSGAFLRGMGRGGSKF